METMPIRKLPVGIQDFTSLIEDGFLYVDKTDLVYRMVTTGKPYFLSRPRRFGKSLLLSTLEAYFLSRETVPGWLVRLFGIVTSEFFFRGI